VQAAIEAQLSCLATEHPNARCGLVTFNSDVALVGDGTKPVATLAGDALASGDAVRDAVQTHGDLLGEPIKGSLDALTDKVFALEEGGQTALGPAVYASVALAASTPGSRVVICTDGLANVGCGSLESEEDLETSREFYSGLASFAQERGVTVSIVTIDGTEADLDTLEILSEKTGGDVEIVDPLQLAENFSSMLCESVVASKVSVTMKLHSGLCFRHEDAAVSTITREIGNVNKNSEVLFEYKIADNKLDCDELPFQVQIRYTALSGMEALRVISHRKPVTRDRQEALKSMDVAMCAARATQLSSELASKGRISEARLNSRAWRHTMASHVCSKEASVEDQQQYKNFCDAGVGIEDSYAAPVVDGRRNRRGDVSSRWQFKGKHCKSSDFM
jgi:hypothetical protein